MIPRAQTFGAVFGPASARGAGWELAAAGVVRAVLWLTLPMLILQVFDRVLPGARSDDFILLAAAVAAALAVRAAIDLAAASLVETAAQAEARASSWAAISRLFSGGASVAPPVGAVSVPVSHLLILAGLPVLAVALAYLAGAMALPAILLAVAAAGAGHVIHRRENPAPSADGIAVHILDILWTVKAMGAENLVLRQAEGAARDAAATGRNQVRSLFAAGRTMTLFDRITLVLAILTGTVLCLNGLITVGQLAAGGLISS
ncbi:MAG TPA: hypothetical protein DC046_06155, partial [Rhodospirillaceae bacterium]|nr:hypothetical protein [Rhodospirillaceae bacterium]